MELVSQVARKAMQAGLDEKDKFPGERSSEGVLAYPKTTDGACCEFRLRGLKCGASTLVGLVEQGVVRPAGHGLDLQWT